MSELILLILVAVGLGLVNAAWVCSFICEETSTKSAHPSVDEAAAFPA